MVDGSPDGTPAVETLMIDAETADEGSALISTAIAELIEHAHEEAVVMARGDLQVIAVRVDRLREIGADMAALADAMEVLARRGGGTSAIEG